MSKLISAAIAVLAIGLWLIPVGAAAQGRATGRADGATGGFGSHAPLGTPGADAGNGHGSAHAANTSGPRDSGKKSADQLLSQNKNLSENLNNLLSKTGLKNPDGSAVTAQEACAKFKNLGQCVAAIHVANNLGISFNQLACDMTLQPVNTSACPTGTGSKGMSLGASIDALKPGTDGKAESQKAVTQANQDLKGSGS